MAQKRSTPVAESSRFEPLTDGEIKAQTDSGSYSRGSAYYREGRIHDTVLGEKSIEAPCQGSDIMPYRLTSTLQLLGEPEGSLLYASCWIACPPPVQKAWTVLVDIHLEDGDVAAALEASAKVGKQARSSGWYVPGLESGDQQLRLAGAAERDFPDEAV